VVVFSSSDESNASKYSGPVYHGEQNDMNCRDGCGACCIAPSINQPFLGMPQGKPAGVRCVHLDDQMRCRIFNDPQRPPVCSQFQAESWVCGDNREQALHILQDLEHQTKTS
jgi:hypothetical protein